MNNATQMTRLTALLALCATACTFDVDRQLEPGQLTGTVVVTNTEGRQVPAENATVRLQPGDLETLTDGSGRFVLTGLTAGSYLLRCDVDTDGDGRADAGFLRRDVVIEQLAGATGAADLGSVEAGRLGAIEGRFLDGDTPRASALVTLRALVARGSAERVVATNDDGSFRIDAVVPGTWTLEAFSPRPLAAASMDVTVGPSGIGRANLVAVEPPQALEVITGTALRSDGGTAPIEITVTDSDEVARLETPPGEPFEFPVPPGLYVLVARDTSGKLPPVVVPDVLVAGPVDLPPFELPVPDGEPLDCLELASAQDCNDLDGDGLGDGLDLDADDDGVLDPADECPLRTDPPDLERRPGGCAPYPSLGVVVRAPDSVRSDAPFTVRVRGTGGTGAVVTALEVVGGESLTAALEPLEAGRWQVTASGEGTLTLKGTATDSLGSQRAQTTVSVSAPPLIVLAEETVTQPVDEPFVVEARLNEELDGVVWQWTAAGLDLSNADTRAVSVLTDTPGTYTLEVEAIAGARRGTASVEVVVVAPPIALEADGLNDEGTFELTVGEPTPFSFRPEIGDEVIVGWSSTSGLSVTGEGTQVVLEATQPGTHALTISVSRGARAGTLTVDVLAHPVSPITLVTNDTLVTGVPTTLTASADPLFDDAQWTWTARASNPSGAIATPQGNTLLVTATATGTYTFEVEARTGRRVAAGLITIQVVPPPLRIATITTPRPILIAGQTLLVEASSPDLTEDDAASWSWSAHEDNPSLPALEDADTEALTFTPDQKGVYRFDVTVVSGERQGSAVVTLDVEGPPPFDIGTSWSGNIVGETLVVQATVDDTLSGDELWVWTQSLFNPEALTFTHASPQELSAQPTVPGTYLFTVTLIDGERSGTANVEVNVLPDESPNVAVNASTSRPAATVGTPLSASAHWSTAVSLVGTRWRWESDPSNPAEVEFDDVQSRFPRLSFPEPGLYRVTVFLDAYEGATLEPRSGQASLTIRAHPAIPIEAWADDTPAGQPFLFHGRTPDASGPASWSWRVVEYASSSRPSISDRFTADPRVVASRTGEYVLEVTARIGARESTTRVTGTIIAGTATDRWVDAPGQASSWVHAPHHGTVGQPLELNALCSGCASDTTFAWTQLSGPADATLENADQPKMRVTASQPGTYVFRLSYNGPGYAGSAGGTTVEIAASQPDIYIDGQAGIGTAHETLRSRFWACRSGRSDVESITWEKVAGGLDGVTTVDGAWLHFDPDSLRRRIAAWKCTVTTTGGEIFTKTRPIVAVSHGSRHPDNVIWVKPHEGGEGGGAGTFDDPVQGLTNVLFRCFVGVCFGSEERTFILTPGVYELSDYYDHSATGIIGSVDPVTFEQDVVAHPSILRWNDADFASPLWRVNGAHLDGLRLEASAKEGSTHPLVVLGVTSENTKVVRNIVEVNALAGQKAVALQVETSGAAEPAVLIAGNRFRVTGGTGSGALVDNCRGVLWAHNLLDVGATSTHEAGFLSECNWLHRQRPAQVVNNAVRMSNGGTGFNLWGTPGTDTGHVFGGNWFAGEGDFVVAAEHVPAALHLSTAAEVNAALSGGQNADDPACFGDAKEDLADEGLAAGSSCAGNAVAPSALRGFALDQVAFDASGTALDVPTGWSDGSIDPGPRQVP